MKKKVLIGTILPVLATVAVIGSGYSIFYLGDQTATNNNSMSADITQVVGVGSIKAADTFKLVFDQTTEGRNAITSSNSTAKPNSVTSGTTVNYDSNTSATFTGTDETALGVHFHWEKSDANKVVKYTSAKGVVDELADYDVYDVNGSKGGVYFVFTATFKLDATLYSYVNMEAGTTDFECVGNDNTYTYTFTATNKKEFDLSAIKLSYKSNMEPSTTSEYKDLKDAISSFNSSNSSSSTNSVTYEVKVYAGIKQANA